jgi:hypothetical protein
MDTGSVKTRTSDFSWHCLLSLPVRTGWLFFALMALIATMEPAMALCANPLRPNTKCCVYSVSFNAVGIPYTRGDSTEVKTMEECMAVTKSFGDVIMVSPEVGCALPGVGIFDPPIPPPLPASPSDLWHQYGVIMYKGPPSNTNVCTGLFQVPEIPIGAHLFWPYIASCTLNLTGPGGTDVALADVEPSDVASSKQVEGLRAEALCDGVPTPKDITLTLTAVDNSGGHQHIPGRPTGNLSVTGGTTPLTFAYTAPAVSGDYTVTARCTDGTCNEATGFVWVGIHGLVNIPSSGFWNLIPNTDTGHPANKYLTGEAFGKLAELARLYTQVYFPLNTPVLQLNDASLERGGLFDLGPNYGYTYWNPQHHEHRRGSVIDIQANGGPLAIPKKNFEEFRELLRKQKMKWLDEKLNASGGHFHVRLNGVKE